uniref:Cell wall hydroxyproline-rich glycoprotein n=1 Tax=Solanum lycopersicum TaxID=4081 RepID=A0A3Q7INM8_SOLLC
MRPPSRGVLISFFVITLLSYQISYVVGQEGDSDIGLDDIKANASKLSFENSRIRDAYIALQYWKTAMFSDPFNFTANWTGPNVCSYGGVFCAPSLMDDSIRVVAGIDLNHADIAGSLVAELGLLTDLVLFHLNSNRFCGVVPKTFSHLKLLRELDLSNNRFVGGFPKVVLSLPSLKFLDLRFNDFEGPVPSGLFDKDLDALFLNDNRFRFGIPENLGNSPVSVLVFANNDLGGCIPASIGKMGKTLNELILMNDNLTGCLPMEIGLLNKLTVFDVSFNKIQGSLPSTVSKMRSVEELNVAHNKLTGVIPASICQLPRLQNFTYSFNYFTGEAPVCAATRSGDGQENCIVGKKNQRSAKECSSDDAKPYDCRKSKCYSPFATSPSTKPKPKPKPRGPPPPTWKSSGSHNKRSPPPPKSTPLPPPAPYKKSPTYQHRSPPPPTHKISPVTHHSPPPPSPVYYHPSPSSPPPPVYYSPPPPVVVV